MTFGPNQIDGDVDESVVYGYRVVLADTCGNRVGTWKHFVPKHSTAATCCDSDSYTVTFTELDLLADYSTAAAFVVQVQIAPGSDKDDDTLFSRGGKGQQIYSTTWPALPDFSDCEHDHGDGHGVTGGGAASLASQLKVGATTFAVLAGAAMLA